MDRRWVEEVTFGEAAVSESVSLGGRFAAGCTGFTVDTDCFRARGVGSTFLVEGILNILFAAAMNVLGAARDGRSTPLLLEESAEFISWGLFRLTVVSVARLLWRQLSPPLLSQNLGEQTWIYQVKLGFCRLSHAYCESSAKNEPDSKCET